MWKIVILIIISTLFSIAVKIYDAINDYFLAEINKNIVAFKNENMPDMQIGRVKNGWQVLYSDPSKTSKPLLKIFENQKIILANEESRGWRKVIVVIENHGKFVEHEGWIAGYAYDAIP